MDEIVAAIIGSVIGALTTIYGVNFAFKFQISASLKSKAMDIALEMNRVLEAYITQIYHVKENVVYMDMNSNQIKDRAKDRFIAMVGDFADKINSLRLDLELITPPAYYEIFDQLVGSLNGCRQEIKHITEQANNYPELEAAFKKTESDYKAFVKATKELVGVSKENFKVSTDFYQNLDNVKGNELIKKLTI
jgi:hypothetical protein